MAKPGDFDFYCEEALIGKTPINKLYESEKVLAFYHTKPVYEKHIVIIPKEHIHDLANLREEHKDLMQEIIFVARNLAKDLNVEEKGVRLITNLGKFQDTPHLHFHLIEGEKIK
jgi:histidine triad (HIT) family protein